MSRKRAPKKSTAGLSPETYRLVGTVRSVSPTSASAGDSSPLRLSNLAHGDETHSWADFKPDQDIAVEYLSESEKAARLQSELDKLPYKWLQPKTFLVASFFIVVLAGLINGIYFMGQT